MFFAETATVSRFVREPAHGARAADWRPALAAGYPMRLEMAAGFGVAMPGFKSSLSVLVIAAALVVAGCATQASSDYAGDASAASASAKLQLAPPAHGFQLETLGTMIDS